MMVLWSVTLKIGALTKLGLFFPVVCFIYVLDQTLAEQLCKGKGLLKTVTKHGYKKMLYCFSCKIIYLVVWCLLNIVYCVIWLILNSCIGP